ncbi:uncharacterized protein BX664DRAFT_263994 [Halteromyces radiatus]|uniref:uncharacterized protein n=1 Tax=Halteromyces radiatus TaxID=101107 RepID=UPI00221F680D|nr:uncharacterized protein BX664DRAFT_263994 [Halteromyces radiatus]KAI8089343.1 hypothetical protein BX664DRAFT_263994 [Halteromyces radiatus]
MPGVRAEPKYLRDPTSLETLSSGLSRLSSYVTSNLPKIKTSTYPPYIPPQDPQLLYYQQQLLQQQRLTAAQPSSGSNTSTSNSDSTQHDGAENITIASFEKIDTLSSGTLSCLLLGYDHGFQLWDVSQPDNVHEIASIRNDILGSVIKMRVLSNPAPSSSIRSSSSSNKKYSTSLHLYSLKTHEFIPTPQLNIQDDMVFTDIKSNGKAIALGCKSQQSAAIYLFSSYDLSQMYTPLTDVYNHRDGPVFTMGSRFIAYATTLPVLNNDTSQLRSSEKDVKGAAKDIAKEMVNGVKTLGEFGYHRLSNYFSPQQQQPTTSTTTTTASPSHPIVGPTVPSSVSTNTSTSSPVGMVIIRDITKLPKNASSSILSLSTVAHFKPHMHPVAILAFNAAGNLLMSISKQGHTFHIFSLYPTDKHLGNAAHLYNLSRGYTDAQVEDCQFSIDSTWCAVTTARGTTHMYTINPYGGKPEINSHVNGKINNLADLPFTVKRTSNVTSLGPAVRVKQRRPMPADPIADDLDTNTNIASNNSLYPQSLQPHSTSINQSSDHDGVTRLLQQPTASSSPSHSVSPSTSTATTSLASIRNQASTIVSQVSSYLPSTQRAGNVGGDWTSSWAKDKTNENRMFGFDEEESSLDNDDLATKMTNDNTGYQDVYSFHPQGILTLHRLWITKNMVRKKVHGRTVGKWDLSVKEEDIAEWQIARNQDWAPQVGGDDDNMSEDIIDRRQSQQQHQQRHINQWLSHAEIMTYPTYPSNRASNNNNSHESPLWTNPQFSFQVYTDEKTNGATIRHLLSKGIVPPTQTVAVRSETPEPYTSRINRVGKTSAKARSLGNQEEEYMDDALAELEAATHSSSAMASTTGFTSLKKASNGLDRTSSLSFEDAYLISMGGAPVYRSSPNSAQQPPMDDDVYQTIVAAPTHLPLQDSALIQFDSDDDTGSNITSSNLTTLMNSDQQEEKTKQGTRASYSSLDGSFDIQGLGMSDEMTGTSRGEMVFSPDGDNEMGGPSDSMMFDG